MAEINIAALFAAYHGANVVTKDGFIGKMKSVCSEFVKFVTASGIEIKLRIEDCKLVLRKTSSATSEEDEEFDKIKSAITKTDWGRARFFDIGYMDIPSLIKDGRYAVEDKNEGGLKS